MTYLSTWFLKHVHDDIKVLHKTKFINIEIANSTRLIAYAMLLKNYSHMQQLLYLLHSVMTECFSLAKLSLWYLKSF